jgi:receptor expression-enhancing protein 1/2/3/4
MFKTLFLLFLALPQTQGSTFIYSVHLAPLLRGHEEQIDSALTQVKLTIYEFVQDKLRTIWNQAIGTTNAAAMPPAAPNVAAVNPSSMADPLSGAAQMVSGWWNAYAPAIVATGAAYIASRQQAAEAAVRQQRLQRPAASNTNAPVQSDTESRSSVHARRRALEAELAALPPSSPIPATPVNDGLAGDRTSRSSASSVSTNLGEVRKRKESGSEEEEAGKYETIGREDVGDSESPAKPRSSWWWRGSSYQGYESVKSD